MLDIGQGEGDWDPFVKYNVKAGRWFNKDNVELHNPVFVADLANIKTGWLWFGKGICKKQMDPDLSTRAPQPNDTYTVEETGEVKSFWKRGFALRLFSVNSFGGVVELSGNSMQLGEAIKELYEAYLAAAPANPGLLPVVTFTGVIPVTDEHGTHFKPGLSITKWVARPVEFDQKAEAASDVAVQPAPVQAAPVPVPQPAATGAAPAQVAPVAAPVAAAPAPATAEVVELPVPVPAAAPAPAVEQAPAQVAAGGSEF